MMIFSRTLTLPRTYGPLLALVAGLNLPATALAQGDALQESAVASPLAPHSLLMDLDRVGNRLIAVGERGHVLLSDDQAASWTQAEVPVRVTLTASLFVDDQHGWAVGHDGVVLRSTDGGSSWRKLLDGHQANRLVRDHAATLVADAEAALADAPEEQQEALELQLEQLTIALEDADSFAAEGASRPLLDLWFKNANEGFVVGAFGLMLHTTDGGDSWTPWFDHLDNPDAFHLNAIRQIGDALYIAAEAGTLFRSDDFGDSWNLLDSPYEGTFFGLVAVGDVATDQQAADDNATGDNALIAYGLRGHAFISRDRGDSWDPIATGVDASLFGGTRLRDGSVMLVGAAGAVLHIGADGTLLKRSQTASKLPLSNLLATQDNRLLSVGLAGIQPLANRVNP